VGGMYRSEALPCGRIVNDLDPLGDCEVLNCVNIMGRAGLFRTKPKLAAGVLIRVATLLDFPRHSTIRLITISYIVVRP
jgi:hypothetical protein